KNLEEAITSGLDCEALLQRKCKPKVNLRVAQQSDPNPDFNSRQLQDTIRNVDQLMKDVQAIRNQNQPGQGNQRPRSRNWQPPQSRPLICFTCGNEGHKAINCRNFVQPMIRPRGPQRFNNQHSGNGM
ncbi:unnamed protein product, partial [Owenia fusiformis]